MPASYSRRRSGNSCGINAKVAYIGKKVFSHTRRYITPSTAWMPNWSKLTAPTKHRPAAVATLYTMWLAVNFCEIPEIAWTIYSGKRRWYVWLNYDIFFLWLCIGLISHAQMSENCSANFNCNIRFVKSNLLRLRTTFCSILINCTVGSRRTCKNPRWISQYNRSHQCGCLLNQIATANNKID